MVVGGEQADSIMALVVLLVVLLGVLAHHGSAQFNRICGDDLREMLSCVCRDRGYYSSSIGKRSGGLRSLHWLYDMFHRRYENYDPQGNLRLMSKRNEVTGECCRQRCDYDTAVMYCNEAPLQIEDRNRRECTHFFQPRSQKLTSRGEGGQALAVRLGTVPPARVFSKDGRWTGMIMYATQQPRRRWPLF